MSKVVVISGHPNLESSFTNSVILESLETNLNDIDVRRLDALYPDYQIDVEAEQKALLDADVIVMQFPFYWYSVPALMKKWIDDVMSFNFAYGPEGDKLKGKHFIVSTTVGGPSESYDPLGYNHFTIEQLLHPIQQTAYLAGMNYQAPVYTHGMVYIPGVYNTQEGVEQKAREHAAELADRIAPLLKSNEDKIEQLARDWFAKMDKLEDNAGDFHAMLRNDVTIHVPEGTFEGIAGFNDWYQVLRGLFAANCDHQLNNIEINRADDTYHVDMQVHVKATSTRGDEIDLTVSEKWQVVMIDDAPRISRYEVLAG